MMILALLKKGDSKIATEELEPLKSKGPTVREYAIGIENSMACLAGMDRSKATFSEVLGSRNPNLVSASIEDSGLSDTQRTILEVHADIYRGRFTEAKKALPRRSEAGASETERPFPSGLSTSLLTKIAATRKQYERYENWITLLAWSSRGHGYGHIRDGILYVPKGMKEHASSLAPVDLQDIATTRLEAFVCE
jgi:hypothetical protein